MSGLSSEAGLEPGLSVEQIEARLFDDANRHHLAERNIAYWLREIDERGLYKKRGFSSVGDYAMELIGIKPRKAQYLVFIARRLEKLPKIRDAFDAAELAWTKAREIVSVATPQSEVEWLAKASALSNRELEKEVRRHDGRGSGQFATLTISMPIEILEMWNDACELAERISGTELEKWQVLEPSLAEFIGTHLPEEGATPRSTDDEDELSDKAREAVLDRDGWACKFPGCTMRKMLDVHHIEFRSQGGSDDASNLISLCRIHHDLIHRAICGVTGTVGVDLKFERPSLVTEHEPVVQTEHPPEAVVSPPADDARDDDSVGHDDGDESWREEVVADIFDGPRPLKYQPRFKDYEEFIAHWIEQKRAGDLEMRARKRRAGQTQRGAHVCAGNDPAESTDPRQNGGPPTG